MPPHRAQLLLCHEKIEGPHYRGGNTPMQKQYCSLSAYAWCFDCDYYVCDIHRIARHEGHDTTVEYPAQTARPGDRLAPVRIEDVE